MGHNLVTAGMDLSYCVGIFYRGQAVDIERGLDPVLLKDSENPPDSGPPTVVVLTRRPEIILAPDILGGDRIRSSCMACPTQLRVGGLCPGLQVPRQSNRQFGSIGPMDFYSSTLGEDIVETIVRGYHGNSLLSLLFEKGI